MKTPAAAENRPKPNAMTVERVALPPAISEVGDDRHEHPESGRVLHHRTRAARRRRLSRLAHGHNGDEEEPQLLLQEIASERVASLDDALAVIKNGVHRNKVQFV